MVNKDTKSGNISQNHQTQRNPRRNLRLSIDLLSLTTIFLFLSIILFSMKSDTISVIGFNFEVHNFHILFGALGAVSALIALTSLVLMFLPSKAESLAEWIENPHKRKDLFRVFWPILWFGISITFIAGIVDTSNRISDPRDRAIAFFGGIIIYFIAAGRIISLGFKKSDRI